MKKMMGAAICLLITVTLPAQGVYKLWGMVHSGGDYGLGTLFNTDAAGNNFQVKKHFDFGTVGAFPGSTQPVEYNGKFYGLTQYGGINNNGVIFEWDPVTNFYTLKINFEAGNGSRPMGSLTMIGAKFYGTTNNGGSNGVGVIFEWDPSTNVYTKKIDFDNTNGANPAGDLTLSGGKFYGLTINGGSNGLGVIFEWDPASNVFAKKIDLNTADGAKPIGSLTLNGGTFYGLASAGGSNGVGVIFQYDPVTNVYTKRVDLNTANGSIPNGNLVLSGTKYYGMTSQGGSNNFGVIFEWDPATNLYAKRIDFNGTDGAYPQANLSLALGKFYGMTNGGGSNDQGVIFEWDPATNLYTKKIDFNGANGETPFGSLTLNNGKFYAMTITGGSNDFGVIFEWDPATNVYTKKIDFYGEYNFTGAVSRNGGLPNGNLVYAGGKFYGMKSEGGINNRGVIFEWDPALNLDTKKFDFVETHGGRPDGDLTLSGGKYYGMANLGSLGVGVLFEWDPATNVYTKKLDFDGDNGAGATRGLVPYGGKLYGITSGGGINQGGVIFEWDPATNLYTKKVELSTATGRGARGKLTLSGGKFYGMTSAGGSNNLGVIFEWDPVTNVYTKKIDLNLAGGSQPQGYLAESGGKFYGMTEWGGLNNLGVIFEWDPATNVYTKKIDLDNSTGRLPRGSLTQSGGKLYGMTFSGGNDSRGVFFEWDPATNVYTKKRDFNGFDGSGPSGNDVITAPAPVAKGVPGTCVSFPSITIDNTNNNRWVAILDNEGNAVAEIKANGNNLGIVTASMYINNSAVREDAAGTLYLDRNIAITPQSQPTSAVDIRLYITASEFQALKNALNSNGQGAGIDGIANLLIYKEGGDCSLAVSSLTNAVATAAAPWEADYVLSASINSFSSFYFAGNSSTCAPPVVNHVITFPSILWPPNHTMRVVTINYRAKSDCGPVSSWLSVKSNEPVTGTGYWDLAPDWEVLDGHHVKLRAERAGRGNGRKYTIAINSKDANGTITTENTTITVPNFFSWFFSRGIANPGDNTGYIDDNGEYFDKSFDCKVTPNPSTQNFNLQIAAVSNEKIEVRLLDISGRLIKKLNAVKGKTLRFGDELRPGVYMADIIQGSQHKIIKVVKQ